MAKEVLTPIFEKLNITEWRNAGFTGKGITVWNGEGTSGHGANSRQMILDVAPDTTVLTGGVGSIVNNTELLKVPTILYEDGTS